MSKRTVVKWNTEKQLHAEGSGCLVCGEIASIRPLGGIWEQLSYASVSYCISDYEIWIVYSEKRRSRANCLKLLSDAKTCLKRIICVS